jgi:hypothetical protein
VAQPTVRVPTTRGVPVEDDDVGYLSEGLLERSLMLSVKERAAV